MKMNCLDKKVTYYWILQRLVLFLIMTSCFIIGLIYTPDNFILIIVIPGGVIELIVLLYTLIFPFLEQRVYKYAYDNEKLVIHKGILFRSHIVIPIVQIQDISMIEGPLQMLFQIANINISTAGSSNSITSINKNLAKDIVSGIQVKIHDRISKIIEGIDHETL